MKHKIYIILFLIILGSVACKTTEERREAYYNEAHNYYLAEKYTEAKLQLKNCIKIDPEYAPAYNLLAKASMKTGNYKDAYAYFLKTVKLNPKILEAQLTLGKLYIINKQYKEGLKNIEYILKENPENNEARLYKAIALYKLKNKKEGLKILNQLKNNRNHSLDVFLVLSRFYIDSEKNDRANYILKKAISLYPDNKEPYFQLVSLYAKLHKYHKAEEVFNHLESKFPNDSEVELKKVKFYQATSQENKARKSLYRLIDKFPQKTDFRVLLAQSYMQENEYDKAENVLQEGRKVVQEPFKLAILLSDIFVKNNEFDKSVALLELFKEKQITSKNKVLIHRKLSMLYRYKNMQDQALRETNSVLKINPQDVHALYLRGTIRLEKDKFGQAITDLRQVVKQQPDNKKAFLALAEAHFLNDEENLAVNTLKQGLSRFPGYTPARRLLIAHYKRIGQVEDMVEELHELLQKYPNDVPALVTLGESYLKSNNFDEAEQIFEKLLTLSKEKDVIYSKLAKIRLQKNDYQSAKSLFQKAIKEGTSSTIYMPAVEGLVIAMLSQGKTELATDYLQNMLSKNAGNAFLYELMARLKLRESNLLSAGEYFYKAIESKPEWMVPYYRLIDAYQTKDNLKTLVAKIKKELKNNEYSASTTFLLGLIYQRVGDVEKARISFEASLESDPDFVPAANNLAYLIAEKSNNKEELHKALKWAKIAAKSKDPNTLDTLGWVYYKLGNHDLALQQFTEASRLAPNNPTINYHKARLLYTKGNNEKAYFVLKRVLEGQKNYPEKEQALQLMHEIQG